MIDLMQVNSEAGYLVVQNKSDKNQTVAVDLSSSINILANRNTVIILHIMLKDQNCNVLRSYCRLS